MAEEEDTAETAEDVEVGDLTTEGQETDLAKDFSMMMIFIAETKR